MSHLWADQLSVLLSPDRLLVAHRSRGVRPGPMTTFVVSVSAQSDGASGWEPAAAALESLLTESSRWHGAELRVIVSNHFVRYVLVPWSDDLTSEKEHLLLARRHFATTHGPVAKNWAIRMSLDRPGESHVASAMDEALVDRLMLAAVTGRVKLAGVEPLLMTAFNRWRQEFHDETQWFVTVEPGMLCGALVGRDRWMALRRWRLQDDWAAELPLWLSREQLTGDTPAAAVYLMAPSRPDREVLLPGLPVKALGANGYNGRRMDTADTHVAEEAGYLSCIL